MDLRCGWMVIPYPNAESTSSFGTFDWLALIAKAHIPDVCVSSELTDGYNGDDEAPASAAPLLGLAAKVVAQTEQIARLSAQLANGRSPPPQRRCADPATKGSAVCWTTDSQTDSESLPTSAPVGTDPAELAPASREALNSSQVSVCLPSGPMTWLVLLLATELLCAV